MRGTLYINNFCRLAQNPAAVDFPAMTNILISHSQVILGEQQKYFFLFFYGRAIKKKNLYHELFFPMVSYYI